MSPNNSKSRASVLSPRFMYSTRRKLGRSLHGNETTRFPVASETSTWGVCMEPGTESGEGLGAPSLEYRYGGWGMSWKDLPNFSELVAEASLQQYRELPKKGKPKRSKEWTPLATVMCSEGTRVESEFVIMLP